MSKIKFVKITDKTSTLTIESANKLALARLIDWIRSYKHGDKIETKGQVASVSCSSKDMRAIKLKAIKLGLKVSN